MSTSYKSLFPSAAAPVESFPYPDAGGAGSAANISTGAPDTNDQMGDLLLRAHAEGVREGEQKERVRIKELIDQERAKITETILHFQTSVSDYFSRTELEVVQLALAIAAKILHREARADPALLGKLAKAVLDDLHQNTKVKIRVASCEAEAWRTELVAHQDGKTAIEVIGDSSLKPQSCLLETELGTTDIGIEAQLHELENGLFDLLAETPQPPAQ
jgi:flagellar assembly protein FliH